MSPVRVVVVLLACLVACGNSSGSSTDGGPGDDQPGDDAGGGGNTPHTVKVTLTNRPNNADMFSFLVAYQDGQADWKLAPPPTGDTYSFSINAPVYGVAYTCIGTQPGTTTQLRTVTSAYFAVGERTELTFDVPPRCSDRTAGNITLNGNVSNRPGSGTLVVVWGNRSAFVGPQSGNFQLTAPPGTHDLFVIHAVPEGNGDFYTDQFWVARDVALSGTSTRQINFAEAHNTYFFGVNVDAADPSARITSSTTLYTANSTQLGLDRETSNWSLNALATDQMRTSDVYDQSLQVAVTGHSATITRATNDPADLTWDPPAPLGMVQTSVATKMPYVVLQTAWMPYADVDGYTWAATQQLTGSQCGSSNAAACTVTWQAALSPGVTGALPAFRMPDLHALTGWKPAFELVSGATTFGSVTAYTSTAGAADFPAGIPANGTIRTFVRSDFALTP